MTRDPSPSPFELAAAELRALGITLTSLPGEYRVNFHNGADATARMTETLDEALELGRTGEGRVRAKARASSWAGNRSSPRTRSARQLRAVNVATNRLLKSAAATT